jgi:hypothetical protein
MPNQARFINTVPYNGQSIRQPRDISNVLGAWMALDEVDRKQSEAAINNG